MQNCVRQAIALLGARYGMEPQLAYAYLSAATDFDISQVVDVVKGVHARIRTSDFGQFGMAERMPQPDGRDVPVHLPDGVPTPDGLSGRLGYESALMSDDVAALDACSLTDRRRCAATTTGLLVGHEDDHALPRPRGGAPKRRIVDPSASVDDDHAWLVAVTAARTGGRGLQTQLWAREPGRWRITAAHVSAPAPAFDTRIWRVVGEPLLGPTGAARSTGRRSRSRTCSPSRASRAAPGTGLAGRRRAAAQPPAVSGMLLDAGASVRGIARTDEFAYSIAGLNAAYGTPPNPKAPGAVSGGSSAARRRRRAGPRDDRARHRHRRLDPGPGGVPGPLRHPHDARRGERRRPAPARAELRHGRLGDPRR